MRIRLLIVLAVVAALAVSCKKEVPKHEIFDIVGTWQMTSKTLTDETGKETVFNDSKGNYTVEFCKDGTLKKTTSPDNKVTTGTYTFFENLSFGYKSLTYQFKDDPYPYKGFVHVIGPRKMCLMFDYDMVGRVTKYYEKVSK